MEPTALDALRGGRCSGGTVGSGGRFRAGRPLSRGGALGIQAFFLGIPVEGGLNDVPVRPVPAERADAWPRREGRVVFGRRQERRARQHAARRDAGGRTGTSGAIHLVVLPVDFMRRLEAGGGCDPGRPCSGKLGLALYEWRGRLVTLHAALASLGGRRRQRRRHGTAGGGDQVERVQAGAIRRPSAVASERCEAAGSAAALLNNAAIRRLHVRRGVVPVVGDVGWHGRRRGERLRGRRRRGPVLIRSAALRISVSPYRCGPVHDERPLHGAQSCPPVHVTVDPSAVHADHPHKVG